MAYLIIFLHKQDQVAITSRQKGYSYRWVAMNQEMWEDRFNVVGNFKVMAQLAFWITSCFQELILESNESDRLRSPLRRSWIQRSPLGCG